MLIGSIYSPVGRQHCSLALVLGALRPEPAIFILEKFIATHCYKCPSNPLVYATVFDEHCLLLYVCACFPAPTAPSPPPLCHCALWTGCKRKKSQTGQPKLLCVKDKVCCHMLHEDGLSFSLTPQSLPFISLPPLSPSPPI